MGALEVHNYFIGVNIYWVAIGTILQNRLGYYNAAVNDNLIKHAATYSTHKLYIFPHDTFVDHCTPNWNLNPFLCVACLIPIHQA